VLPGLQGHWRQEGALLVRTASGLERVMTGDVVLLRPK
jgi:hypothetical protein